MKQNHCDLTKTIVFSLTSIACLLSLFSCDPAAERISGNTNDDALEVNRPYLERLNDQGDSATAAGDYAAAITFYQKAMEIAAVEGDSFPYYDAQLDLACVHERLREFPKAIELGEDALAAFIRSGDSTRIGRAYSTLSSFYGLAEIPEKQMATAQKGFEILKNYGSLIERCAAYNQMAFTYSGAGDWAKALPLLDSALLLMKASGYLDQLPGLLLNIGDCHRNLGHYEAAKKYLKEAAAGCDSLGYVHIHARAVQLLSMAEESTGNIAEALQLYKTFKILRDSVINEEKNNTIQQLKIEYETEEKERENQLLKARQQTEVARRNMALALWGVTISAIGLWLYFRREKARRLQAELAQNRQQLEEFAQLLLAKNTRLMELEQNQERPTESAEPEEDTADSDTPESVALYDIHILTEKDWTAFKRSFERSYPGFIHRLRTHYSDITNAEERLFLLYKLNFTRHEIATILGVSEASVKKGRTRLRKRLGLQEEQDLEHFIQSF
ncbi:MAG: sigma-70 family RNA polymerase sigma factor [Saprospiraceae bacterium]|nr:sigma-70 family RNA polymerase sigma factor [Saprospiraceae bacterium]